MKTGFERLNGMIRALNNRYYYTRPKFRKVYNQITKE